jgi:hypothetical protein
MLSKHQAIEFQQRGYVRLGGAFAESAAQRMCESVWDLLARKHRIYRDRPDTWQIERPTGFQALTQAGAFDEIASPSVTSTLDQMLGRSAWPERKHWGAPLVTFPSDAHEWHVPCRQWHLDFPARAPAHVLAGVRILAFVSAVAPHGGGTLAVQGSHRLVERLVASGNAGRGRSPEIRTALSKASSWFRALLSSSEADNRVERFMQQGIVLDRVEVRVVELTGRPGDVVFMHPWTFHAPSTNVGTEPRIMVSDSIFRATKRSVVP